MDEKNSLLDVSENEKFITNYKAVYQAMTAKHDCKSKIFPRNVKIKINDIIELNERVSEKLRNYHEAGFSTSVSASFIGRQSIEFSSWQEFEKHKWTESRAISSITVIWEFNAVLPQYGVPQKHVLVVKMTDGLKPEEMLNIVFAGKLENIEEIGKQMYPVVARVDFINYVLGDELMHIVEEWNNGLDKQEEEEYIFPKLLVKHRRKLAFVLNYMTNMLALFCGAKIITFYIESSEATKLSDLTIHNLCELIWITGAIVLAYLFINRISQWLSNIFYRIMGEERTNHIFCINKGDQNIQKQIEKELKKNKYGIIGSVIGTIALNLICSLVCAWIVK